MQYIDVAAGILWRDKCYLAVSRPAKKTHAGRWEFPGGKIEQGEHPKQALCRELLEELNIHVDTASFWRMIEHEYAEHNLHVRLHFFHVTAFTGEPSPQEGQKLHWTTPQQATQLDFLEADLPLVQELASKTFSLPQSISYT